MRTIANFMAAAALLLAIPATAQITLEHTYPASITMTRLSSGRELYVVPVVHSAGAGVYEVGLYNLNHSLYRQMMLPAPAGFSNSFSVSYVSDKLFDGDSTTIEMMMGISRPVGSSTVSQMRIMRQDGSTLFTADSVISRSVSILNTRAGAKMLVYQKVYSLPGTYSAVAVQEDSDAPSFSPAFPNPTTGTIHLPYSLRAGQAGVLVITDLAGREVSQYQIGAGFADLLVETRSFAPGTYFYQVQAGGQTSPAARFVVSH